MEVIPTQVVQPAWVFKCRKVFRVRAAVVDVHPYGHVACLLPKHKIQRSSRCRSKGAIKLTRTSRPSSHRIHNRRLYSRLIVALGCEHPGTKTKTHDEGQYNDNSPAELVSSMNSAVSPEKVSPPHQSISLTLPCCVMLSMRLMVVAESNLG